MLLLLLFSCQVMSDSLQLQGLQNDRLPCPSPSAGVFPSSCPLNRWHHPTISSSITLFAFCPQSLPASGSFPMSQLFPSGGQSIGASASASVLPMCIQCWFPLILTDLIFLLSKGLSRVFSSTKVGRINYLALCLPYYSTPITMCDHWEDHSLDCPALGWQSNVSAFQHTV